MIDKETMYIKFPADGSGSNVQKKLPFPKSYFNTDKFKENNIKTIIIDFSETDYMDSLALTYIINLTRLLKIANKKVVFNGMKESISKIIKLTKLDNLFKQDNETLEDFYNVCSKPCDKYSDSDMFFKYVQKMTE